MNIDEIAKMVNVCAARSRRANDYGSHDHNCGVYRLKRGIMRRLAYEHAKSAGLKRIVHIDPVELERTLDARYDGIHFTCCVCDDYSRRKLVDGDDTASFYCQQCGALWTINKKWSFALNEQWSK